MYFPRKANPVLLVALFVITLAVQGFGSPLLVYSQPTDYGFSYASQNDTNGNGNFATAYDNFTLGSTTNLRSVLWIGSYFNGSPATIAAWTVSFYSDAAGQPGTLLWSTNVSGNGSETYLQLDSLSDPTYQYSVSVNFTAQAGAQYWLAVVPDLGYPPQWGWETGTGGDGISYQDFEGTRYQDPNDLAFSLYGGQSVPEPGTLLLLTTGTLGLAGSIRRRRS